MRQIRASIGRYLVFAVSLVVISACGGGGSSGGGSTTQSSTPQGLVASNANQNSSQNFSASLASVSSASSSRVSSLVASLSSAASTQSLFSSPASISASSSSQSIQASASSISISLISSSSHSTSSVRSSNSISSSATSASSNSLMTLSLKVSGLIDGNSNGTWEQARDVAVDDQGYVYVVGGVSSLTGFPITSGALDTSYNDVNAGSADTSYTGQNELGGQGGTDAFVTKLDPQGNVVWSTYLGGPNYDRAYAVEVDSAHNVYVGGRAGRGFPTTLGSIQPVFAGDSVGNGEYGKQDGFVAKISADGSQLLWATYFGESAAGFIRDIDVDAQGRVHLVATNITANDLNRFVTAGAGQTTKMGTADSFYARLSSNGSQVEYGSYLGGNDTGAAFSGNPAVRVLPDGTAFVLVSDQGPNAPVTANVYQPNYGGKLDLILAKFSPLGSAGKMDACTYLGGSDDDFMDTHHLAISPEGNPIVTAGTKSTNYPVTRTSVFNSSGKSDIAVSVLSSDLTTLLYSRVIGGSSGDSSEGIDVDAAGNIYVTGSTGSSDLPVTTGALHTTDIANEREGFLLVYSPDLSQLKYFSYDNVRGEYANRSSIVGANGLWYVVGATWNMTPFPSTGSLDSVINGTHAAFFQVFQVAP